MGDRRCDTAASDMPNIGPHPRRESPLLVSLPLAGAPQPGRPHVSVQRRPQERKTLSAWVEAVRLAPLLRRLGIHPS